MLTDAGRDSQPYLSPVRQANADLNAIKQLCQQYRVQRLSVVGSVLTTVFRPDSDVELVMEYEDIPLEEYADNYFRFKFALEDLLGRPVAQAIRNPYFRQQLEAIQQLLYAA